jgi:hypothetical protein
MSLLVRQPLSGEISDLLFQSIHLRFYPILFFFVIHVLFHLKYSYELPVSDQKKFLFQSFGIQL